MIKKTYNTDQIDELIKVFAPDFNKSGLHENMTIIFTMDNEEFIGETSLWYGCWNGWSLEEDCEISNVELARNVVID